MGDGGECQYTLDVTLHTCHTGGIECREGSYVCHDVQHAGSIFYEQREHACHQIDPCNHHRGGMNQCTDGRRTFHGIGQPDVQREHGTLSGTTDEHQSQGKRNHCRTALCQRHLIRAEGVCTGIIPIDEDTYKESQVSKTGHDKSLLRSGNSRRLRIIETNQQIGGHDHQLPEQIHLEDIRCYYQSEHGHGEERQEGVVTLETAFALHVAERVYVYQQRNGTDDHEHHNRNRVE